MFLDGYSRRLLGSWLGPSGFKRHNNLTYADSLTHFSPIGITGETNFFAKLG